MAFKDFSTNNFQLTAFGNAQISTSVKKYGDGSAYFDGNGDYLIAPYSSTIEPGSSDLTWEMWINTTNSTQYATLYSRSPASFDTGMWSVLMNSATTNGDVNLWCGDYSVSTPLLASTGVSIRDGVWHHIAIVRNGSNWTLYIDGVSRATNTWSGTIATISNSGPFIGRDEYYIRDFTGYIDDLRITKGIARYTSNFTPPQQQLPTTADPYFSNVSLLLPMNLGPFTDSSTNNFQLSAVGNADLSTVVKKYGTASGYFDGNGDYLELTDNDAFELKGNDFTIECWIRPTILNNEFHTIASKNYNAGDAQGWLLYIAPDNAINFLAGNGGWSVLLFSNFTPSLNTWHHVTVTRSGNSWRLFIDGDLKASTTNSVVLNAGNLPLYVGWYPYYNNAPSSPTTAFGGYIDDLRITKGIARYTTNFTPPPQQLPDPSDPYQDNVSLLLHMDNNQFVDASLNNFTITPFGNARSSTQVVKYGDTAALFDGNGDYLEIASNDAFNFGTGSFTIEAWVYLNSIPSDYFITSANSFNNLFFGFRVVGGQNQIGWGGVGDSWHYEIPSGITTGQWYHVALTRSGTDMRLFVNGNQVGTTQTRSTSYNLGAGNLAIGAQANSFFFNGYIDDLRITKGIARYTTTFTPPSAQLPTFTDPDFANVSLLLQTNRPFTDSSSNNFALSAFGNAQISTSVKKFGSGAGYFDGSGDYLDLPVNAIQFNADDFTIEFWVNPTRTGSHTCVANWDCSSNMTIFFAVDTSAGVVVYLNGTGPFITGGSIQVNQWQHVALVRQGADMKAYINGVQAGNTYNIGNTAIDTIVDNIRIGRDTASFNCNSLLEGYIDELRITKGVARYTSNFVPHTAPFVNPPRIPSGYLAFWKLDDLTDSSPNGNNLVNTNNVQFVSGKIGNCAQFNGTNYLSVNPFIGSTLNTFSVAAWIKRTSSLDGFVMFFSNHGGFCFYSGNNPPGSGGIAGSLVVGDNSTWGWVSAANTIPLDQWVHVCVTVTDKVGNIYINSQYVGNTQGLGDLRLITGGMLNGQIRIGGETVPAGSKVIDAVGIWNRALTQSEIDILYNNGNGREP